jgi:hypothetical protein
LPLSSNSLHNGDIKIPMALEASRNSLNLNQPNGTRPFFIWRIGGLQVSSSDD